MSAPLPCIALKNGDRLAFLHPLADQQRTLGADIAQIHSAVTDDGSGIIVGPVGQP